MGGSGTVITVTNGLFAGNSDDGIGINSLANVVHMTGGSLRLINSTVAGNTGFAPFAFAATFGGTLTVENSILWENNTPFTTTSASATVTLHATTVGPGGSDPDPLLARLPNPGDGDWTTFADNDYGDLHLTPLSPAIDAGDGARLPAGIALDFDGQPRVFDANHRDNAFAIPVDRGADEARFVGPTAAAGGPYSGAPGVPVPLDGSGSADDAAIASFAWDCTGDGTFETTLAIPTGASCTYPAAGLFTVRLRVTDADGLTADATATVTITAPVENPEFFNFLPAVAR
jgi:hypothetical protein